MGWFRKAFKPKASGPTAFPFSGEVRMYHEDCERLATGWRDGCGASRPTLLSPAETPPFGSP